jgi:hypothetical protein
MITDTKGLFTGWSFAKSLFAAIAFNIRASPAAIRISTTIQGIRAAARTPCRPCTVAFRHFLAFRTKNPSHFASWDFLKI